MQNSHLSVYFFLDSKLPVETDPHDFFSGKIGLSGSDGTLLRVAKRLADRGIRVCVYNFWWDALVDRLKLTRIGSASDFLRHVGRDKPSAAIFNYYVARPASLEIAQAPMEGTRKLLWDQNGADFRFVELTRRGAIDEIVCVSHSAREWFRSTSAFGRTRVIYNVCDDTFFQRQPRRPDARTVLFVGALRPVKGFHGLALAWPYVHQSFRDARLAIAGSDALHERRSMSDGATAAVGEYHETVVAPFKAWAARAGADVQFLGTVSPRDLIEWHSRSICCVVNPSEAGAGETFCCSAVEAELCGNPVVSVENGSLPEVTLPGQTSLLAKSNDPRDLARCLLELLTLPARVDAMSRAASEFARAQFATDAIIDEWERAIRGTSAIASRRAAEPLRTRAARDLLRLSRIGDFRRRRRDAVAIAAQGEFPFRPFTEPADRRYSDSRSALQAQTR